MSGMWEKCGGLQSVTSCETLAVFDLPCVILKSLSFPALHLVDICELLCCSQLVISFLSFTNLVLSQSFPEGVFSFLLFSFKLPLTYLLCKREAFTVEFFFLLKNLSESV